MIRKAIASFGSIPACDAQTTRDTLSDLNKKNKFNASKYNFIKKVSASDSETICMANLALSAGGTVEYDCRIDKEGSLYFAATDTASAGKLSSSARRVTSVE